LPSEHKKEKILTALKLILMSEECIKSLKKIKHKVRKILLNSETRRKKFTLKEEEIQIL
jgi:hypothetical protein